MIYTFGISTALLVVFVLFRSWELTRGVDTAPGIRDALDRAVTRSIAMVLRSVYRAYMYVRRDVLARGLQATSVIALRAVRRAERVLTRWVGFFQSATLHRPRNRKPAHTIDTGTPVPTKDASVDEEHTQ